MSGTTEGLEDAEAVGLSVVTTILGVPLPPTVAKNALRAFSSLVLGAVDVPVAWLQEQAQGIRNRTTVAKAHADAEAAVHRDAAKIAAKTLGKTPDLAMRATLSLGRRLLQEQESREDVVSEAFDSLRQDPPKQDVAEIDQDWLNLFARHASTRTSTEMKTYLSRILAGEIRKPGAFSPRAIEVLSTLTPFLARLFQRACSVLLTVQIDGMSEHFPARAFIVASPYGGSIGGNALAELDLHFTNMSCLAEAGLVRPNFDSSLTLSMDTLLSIPWSLGGARVRFCNRPGATASVLPLSMAQLTVAGAELASIVHASPNALYVEKFKEWAATQGFDMELLVPPS